MMPDAAVSVRFYEELNDHLPEEKRKCEFAIACREGMTVRDLLDGLRVPISDVDLVLVEAEPVGLTHVLQAGNRISVYPVFESLDIRGTSRVRSRPLREPRFAVLGLPRLDSYLRILGLESCAVDGWAPGEIVGLVESERRVLLTGNRDWLSRHSVSRAVLIRTAKPRFQAVEVLLRLDLTGAIHCPATLPTAASPLRRGRLHRLAEAIMGSALPKR